MRSNPRCPELNEEQRAAFEGILSLYDGEHASASLLYGVTGSGKTSVYVHLIDAMRRKGKASILLVPEITLTPQMIRIFSSYFGDDVAVLHSLSSPLASATMSGSASRPEERAL